MASISSFYYQNAQTVFDVIEDQFTLQPDPLVELTKAFINEFKIGLANYNQPMAMMYAAIFFTKHNTDLIPVPHLLQVFPMVQRQGTVTNPFMCQIWSNNAIYPSTFLALDLGGTNLWLKFYILKERSNRP